MEKHDAGMIAVMANFESRLTGERQVDSYSRQTQREATNESLLHLPAGSTTELTGQLEEDYAETAGHV